MTKHPILQSVLQPKQKFKYGFEYPQLGTSVADVSGNSGHALMVNMAGTERDGVTKKVGNYSLKFDGVNDYVEQNIMRSRWKFYGRTGFTIMGWVRPTALTFFHVPFSWGIDTTGGSNFRGGSMSYDATGALAFSVGNTSPIVSAVATTLMSAGTWTHLAGVFDGRNKLVNIVVNGVQEASTATAFGDLGVVDAPIRLGTVVWAGAGQFWFNGHEDEFQYLPFPMNADQIKKVATGL